MADLKTRLAKLEGVSQIHLIALDRADETEAEALARRPAPPGARVILIDTGIYRSGGSDVSGGRHGVFTRICRFITAAPTTSRRSIRRELAVRLAVERHERECL